jgi:hypothetical protein
MSRFALAILLTLVAFILVEISLHSSDTSARPANTYGVQATPTPTPSPTPAPSPTPMATPRPSPSPIPNATPTPVHEPEPAPSRTPSPSMNSRSEATKK